MTGAIENAGLEADRRRAVVVLGMHRSGTSAVAAALAEAGWSLPNDLMRPQFDNPTGFNESLSVVRLNDRILGELGSSWKLDNVAFPELWKHLASPALVGRYLNDARKALREAFSGRSRICCKDPRWLLASKLWHRALTADGYSPTYVLSLRHPCEVVDSLLAREPALPRPFAFRLWARYMLFLLALPEESRIEAVIDYDRLTAHPENCLRESLLMPTLTPPGMNCTAVIPSLRHHFFNVAAEQNTPRDAEELYHTLLRANIETSADRRLALQRYFPAHSVDRASLGREILRTLVRVIRCGKRAWLEMR
ncbi:MAG: sulfotransferase family protein [Gammaproteobacteria bacterium]